MKGDLHIHTNLEFPTSHDWGDHSVAEILGWALDRQYQYLGLTDHNPPQNGLAAKDRLEITQRRAERIRQEVADFAQEHPQAPQVWVGFEIDITPNGALALEEESLNELDYAIVSIHTSFRQPAEEMTSRILRALAHPKVKILGHPSGRLLLRRSGIQADWGAIFAFCVEHRKFLEINASPDRLDLSDSLARQAILAGAKLTINTDTHSRSDFANLRYGVWNARRAWATKADILNTFPLPELRRLLLN